MQGKLLTFSRSTRMNKYLKMMVFELTKQRTIFNYEGRFAFSSVKKQTKYILSQFPYPSGDLHLGHARVYLIGDTLTRFYKLKGFDVLYPMGWDSFGLPAENAAIVNKQNPKEWTQKNIQRMKNQLNQLQIPFPWQRQISTCTPEYYKWTQWIFLKMYQLGLAYKSEAEVNWDPIDKTVLANEQVDQSGHSWRSGAKVEKRVLSQWFLNIKQFAEDLDKQLSVSNQSTNKYCTSLRKWIAAVKDMQKGWIGLKKGYKIKGRFKGNFDNQEKQVQVFLQQGTFNQLKSSNKGYLQINLNQQGQHEIVGSISFSGLHQVKVRKTKQPAKQEGIFSFVLKQGSSSLAQYQQWIEKVDKTNSKIMRLKDWLISRQRYWGTPIPIIYCKKCGTVPVSATHLPVVLPQWPESNQIQSNTNPLLSQQFKLCECPKCGGPAQRESDTMDTFVDSSWYYLRFLDPFNKRQIIDPKIAEQQMPVHIYIGGMQHAIMHLLYARFVYRVLHRCGITSHHTQPFQELIVQGLIKGKTYKLKANHAYLKNHELELYQKHQIVQSFQKMSKSKFNGVSPGQILQKFSVDQLRIALLFAGPPQNDIDFHQEMLINARRFLYRIEEMIKFVEEQHKKTENQLMIVDKKLLRKYPQLLTALNGLFDRLQLSMDKRAFHTYVANIMEITNLIRKIVFSRENIDIQYLQEFSSILWVFSIAASPICPQFSQNMQKRIKMMNAQININCQQWPILQRQFLQVIIKKASKVIKKQFIQASYYDQSDGNKKLKQQLGLTEDQVINVKRLKKNVIIIIK